MVRKLVPMVTCGPCRFSLMSNETAPEYKNSYTLLELKQKGGLVVLSEACIKVVMASEKHLHHLLDVHYVD